MRPGLDRWIKLESPSKRGSTRYVCQVCGVVTTRQLEVCDRDNGKPGSVRDAGAILVALRCGRGVWLIPGPKTLGFIRENSEVAPGLPGEAL